MQNEKDCEVYDLVGLRRRRNDVVQAEGVFVGVRSPSIERISFHRITGELARRYAQGSKSGASVVIAAPPILGYQSFLDRARKR